MIRLFRQSAHLASANVQQMAVVFGAVGYSAARQWSLLNHRDRQARRAPQQINRQHGSAEPAPDHNDAVCPVYQLLAIFLAVPGVRCIVRSRRWRRGGRAFVHSLSSESTLYTLNGVQSCRQRASPSTPPQEFYNEILTCRAGSSVAPEICIRLQLRGRILGLMCRFHRCNPQYSFELLSWCLARRFNHAIQVRKPSRSTENPRTTRASRATKQRTG